MKKTENKSINSVTTMKAIEKTMNAMKKILKNDVVKFIAVMMALCGMYMVFNALAGGEYVMAMGVVAGVAGGKHIEGEPLTLQLSRAASPDLLRNEIDDRIVKIRPMATPIDQISRHAGSRRSGSMTVEYYSVDTKGVSTTLESDSTPIKSWGRTEGALLKTANDSIFEPTETIMVPDVMATDENGDTATLVLYVVAKDTTGISVISVNNTTSRGSSVPELKAGTTLVRMGRAAAELDVQTPQFEALPTKKSNNCQIFK